MADEKHHDAEFGKASGIEGDLMASKFESLVDGNIADHSLTPEEDKRLLRKLDMCLLPVMATAYFFQFLDKTALSYTAILGLREDLHLTGSEYSWSSSIYYFGYMVATYPIVGFLLVRYPMGKLISASL
ncbi:hypothetical protein NEMBOFW57_009144 [Staphylotrichum longicolle]|uniref:Allantoate permease n=1 Tax=Staphylotrichum longicolle TaxID=669026 RepID=A0AAD4ESK2_9PEZI|nr:hypothetical protein NEMBOFW57_009144 [Staphylotrichum longicolle]